MPDKPVRRSSRVEQRKRQAEAGNQRIADSEASGSLWVIESRRKELQPIERTAEKGQRGRTTADDRAEVRKVKSSKPLPSHAATTDTVKQAKARKGQRSKQTRGVPESSQVQRRRPAKEKYQPGPTRASHLYGARSSSPPPANSATEQPAPSLSRAALQQLQRETAQDPFPAGIRPYKSALSEDNMPKSTNNANENGAKEKAITVYSQTFLDELTDRGILDQRFKEGGFDFDKPINYDAIRSAILKDRPGDVPSEADYQTFAESLMTSISNETAQRKLYELFFGASQVLKAPHLEQHDEKWNKHEPIIGEIDVKDCKQVPKPDLAEGLQGVEIPRWIRKQLRGYSVPRARLAFPNFLVELKRDKSMYTAHVQNRHCGAVASQAFVEYYARLPDNSESPWNIARVGSIEFNGDVVLGNIHWVSSPDETSQDRTIRKYHMTRVMCRFTYGLSYEDFVVARKEARNFREYFLNSRKEFLQTCKKLPQTSIQGALSVSEEVDRGSDDDSTDSGQQLHKQKGSEAGRKMIKARCR